MIVLSEVGYYGSLGDLHRSLDWMFGALRSAEHLMLVHWTPVVADYALTGDEVHETAHRRAGTQGWRHRFGQRHARYRIDVFEAP